MSDSIDRQVAIETISYAIELCNKAFDSMTLGGRDRYAVEVERNSLLKLKDDFKMLPSAQPEQRWIPCSERLPEDYTDVLVWFEYFRYGDYNCLYQTYGIGDYSTKYDSWMINHETGWRKLRVIAWMPLPEPYQEGEG